MKIREKQVNEHDSKRTKLFEGIEINEKFLGVAGLKPEKKPLNEAKLEDGFLIFAEIYKAAKKHKSFTNVSRINGGGNYIDFEIKDSKKYSNDEKDDLYNRHHAGDNLEWTLQMDMVSGEINITNDLSGASFPIKTVKDFKVMTGVK